MNYFILTSHHFTAWDDMNPNKLTSLPMCGFVAQLVEHRTRIAEVTGSNPVEALILFEKDSRAEAQEHNSNAVGVYLVTAQSDAKKTLAGHVPIELSHLLKNFLEAEAGNKLCAQVKGKRKREVGLVVPARVHCPDIRASHSKNSGKRAYRPSREIQSL